jgi:hypothetical protein
MGLAGMSDAMAAMDPNWQPKSMSIRQQAGVDNPSEPAVESLRDSAARLLQKLRSAEVSLNRISGAPFTEQTMQKETAEPGLTRLLEECHESASVIDKALYRLVGTIGAL